MTVPLIAGSPALAGDMTAALEQLVQDELAALTWSDWSPTLTNLTVGSATTTYRYVQFGKTVLFVFRFVLGAGSAVGTGPTFTLPVTPASHFVTAAGHLPIGSARLLDSGTGRWEGDGYVLSGTTVSLFYATEAGGGSGTNITSTAPFTWTTNDTIAVTGMYEAA